MAPQTKQDATTAAWVGIVIDTLKANKVEFVPYVPDKVLAPLIRQMAQDPFFTLLPVAREEEGLGIVTGAWMAGKRGIVLMQTSGFATLPNVLASLVVCYQIPRADAGLRARDDGRSSARTGTGLPDPAPDPRDARH